MRLRTGICVLALALITAANARAAKPECQDDPCAAGCADVCYFDADEQNPGSGGVAVHWLDMPVKYKINAERAPAGLGKANVLQAIQDAFTTWENVNCSSLAFQYDGETTSFSSEPGYIVVYFGNDAATWIFGTNAYFTDMQWTSYSTGEIEYGVIAMNSGAFDWSIGAEANKIDIQTAVTWMIPTTLGFFAGEEVSTGSLPIFFNKVATDLCASHEQGAQNNYFEAATGCTQPTLSFCTGGSTPTADGGTPTTDGGTPTTDGGTPTTDSGGTPTADGAAPGTDGGAVIGDGGLPPDDGDDDGCCRVSHAQSASAPYLTLLGLIVLLVLARRRRR